MTRSIQSRLALALTCAAVVLSAAMAIWLYSVIGREMVENFDRGLRAKGQAVVSLVSLEAGGVLDFEFNGAVMPEYRAGAKAEYFQIRFSDGRAYAQSKSLGAAQLDLAARRGNRTEAFYDLPLPDARAGRAIRIDFVPQSEEPSPHPAESMVAIIARDRADLNESLRELLQSLIAATLVFAAVTALMSVWIVRRSMRPLRAFADQAAGIDASRLNTRLGQSNLPAELQPICQRLNDLLGRLEAAFARERRFTSDVAHELRTPIAELRSIVEVAMRWPDDAGGARDALGESFAIAVQMQTLVNTLLSLVRADQKHIRVALEPVTLTTIVSETIATLCDVSPIRGIELSIPEAIRIRAEPALLRSVLNNLLLNASEYSVGLQPIRCFARRVSGRVELTVENQTDSLTNEDLPHLFEPFWRKDASRTGDAHAGLGLSLVRVYCGLMGIQVSATLEDATLRIQLTCEPAAVELVPNTQDMSTNCPV